MAGDSRILVQGAVSRKFTIHPPAQAYTALQPSRPCPALHTWMSSVSRGSTSPRPSSTPWSRPYRSSTEACSGSEVGRGRGKGEHNQTKDHLTPTRTVFLDIGSLHHPVRPARTSPATMLVHVYSAAACGRPHQGPVSSQKECRQAGSSSIFQEHHSPRALAATPTPKTTTPYAPQNTTRHTPRQKQASGP